MPLSAPIARQALEDALYAWCLASSGVTVIWANQNAPQPARPYCTLAVTSTTQLGQDAVNVNGAPSSPVSGLEVALEVSGHRAVVVSLNVYGISNDPDADARAIADKALTALALPTFLSTLRAAGIAVSRVGPALSLDFLVDDKWASRVQADVTLSIASNLEERVGYIARVEIENEIVTPSDDFVVDAQT